MITTTDTLKTPTKRSKYYDMWHDEIFWLAKDFICATASSRPVDMTFDISYFFDLAEEFYQEGLRRGCAGFDNTYPE